MTAAEAKRDAVDRYERPYVVFQRQSGAWDHILLADYDEKAYGQPTPLNEAEQEGEAVVYDGSAPRYQSTPQGRLHGTRLTPPESESHRSR